MVERGLRRGQGDGTSAEELYAAIQAGEMSLWAVHAGEDVQAVVVLSVIPIPGGKKLFVQLLAGSNMDEWADELEKVIADCRDILGATCVEASCRPGLARYLGRRGWRRKAEIMELV